MTTEEKLNKAAYLLGLVYGRVSADEDLAARAGASLVGPWIELKIQLEKGINELFYADRNKDE